MSNSNTNLQTQSSNALHNAIMERVALSVTLKTHPLLSPNPPYTYQWAEKTVPVAEVEAVQIILTGIDNDIYSTVDACPNACEMWKAIKRLKQENLTTYQQQLRLHPNTTSRANQDNSPKNSTEEMGYIGHEYKGMSDIQKRGKGMQLITWKRLFLCKQEEGGGSVVDREQDALKDDN
ncbi:hypothetical protein Tco_0212573 [Tanacetum coccineum]